ncbi:hypothetical protein [Massilia sp. TWP1-3-3]|uniref:hypothetical protein n=1 Tax=Massilia sp. TWP1-3-3 TaxID=2804573 RepID=UPI003CE97D1C
MSQSIDLLEALNSRPVGVALSGKAHTVDRLKLTPSQEKEKIQKGKLFLRSETRTYKLGKAERPIYEHDNGFLGPRGYPLKTLRKPTDDDKKAFRTMFTWLEGSEMMCNERETKTVHWWSDRQRWVSECGGNQPDANLALRNFLFGKGKSRTIDYERFLRDQDRALAVPQGTHAIVRQLVTDFMEHAEAIGFNRQKFSITNTVMYAINDSGFAKGPQVWNWRRTIGGHVIWISGDVVAASAPGGTHIIYSGDLTFHMEDIYNFNPGSSDGKMQVKDEIGGKLEESGLGHPFMTYATFYRHIVWDEKHPDSVKISMGSPPPGAHIFKEDIAKEEKELFQAQIDAGVSGYSSEKMDIARKFIARQLGIDHGAP